ncbi:MAG: DUF6468 domain-containing protein [Rickettsiales bacterium]|nr:DUF6468 domain-containing protein [Pseudomonadota bacterium]MDA0965499.1 DUF6468 domain-containing protein [Pseudomonadota bacterium]MDG4542823.1 DUF6468 domain-containing protein [Rickettsiales bacterium]MDG4544729.1 DUF6468 domain-containing protein [Rickettsiales bacterium]MDG4546851.1 DUF6468 domain-containing protein [Rickettsiales bacterium]
MAEILDIIVISLLLVAIVYGVILNRKISILQQSKKELANLFKSFDETILQAQIGIDDLKKVSTEISGLLSDKMDKGYVLIDDLAFLTEKAEKVTQVMDDKVKKAQKKAAVIQAVKPVTPDISQGSHVFTSPNPEEIKALRQQNSLSNSKTKPQENNIKPFVDSKKAKALESLLEQINENKETQKNNIKTNKPVSSFSNNNEKDEEQIVADMLKAIGYGDK